MQKFLEDNKKPILLAVGLGAIASVIGVIVVNNEKKKKTQKPQVPGVTPLPTTNNSVIVQIPEGLTKEEKDAIISKIKITYQGDHLSTETIEQIADAIAQYAAPDYALLAQEERAERRKIARNDLAKYVDLYYVYDKKFRDMVERNKRAVIKDLNMTPEQFDAYNNLHKDRNKADVLRVNIGLARKIRDSLKPTKTLTTDEVKLILQSHIEAMRAESLNVTELSVMTKYPSDAIPIIYNRNKDLLHSKFLVEEEDFKKAIVESHEDIKVQQLSAELDIVTHELITKKELQTTDPELITSLTSFI